MAVGRSVGSDGIFNTDFEMNDNGAQGLVCMEGYVVCGNTTGGQSAGLIEE